MGHAIRSEDGKVLGFFMTEAEYTRLMYRLAHADADRMEKEDRENGVVRRWDGTNGKTSVEAIAHLERLGREAAGS